MLGKRFVDVSQDFARFWMDYTLSVKICVLVNLLLSLHPLAGDVVQAISRAELSAELVLRQP